jgi:hypothetical protein
MTAVFYPVGPCGSFAASRWRPVREIAFEIGMQWQHRRDESDPRETHVLRALPGRAFSALELGRGLLAFRDRIIKHSRKLF